MTPTVAVVGLGNIGSRHLQALAGMSPETTLFAVDPSPEARALGERRYAEVVGARSAPAVRYLDGIGQLPAALHVAIVATTARVRLDVTSELLSRCRVSYLVLEKVLFQRLADYETAAALLEDRGTPTWVNLPRRMYPAYRCVPEALAGASWIDYRVSGSDWGLGCNGIHFLDQLVLIAGGTAVELDAGGLDPGTLPSRRPGFEEFTGTVTGQVGPRTRLSLTCLASGALPLQVSIDSDVARFVIGEHRAEIRSWSASAATGWSFEPTTAELPPQSRMTHLVVGDLLARGGCDLPTYGEAAALHVAFVDALLGHLRASGRETDVCPIT